MLGSLPGDRGLKDKDADLLLCLRVAPGGVSFPVLLGGLYL